MANNTTLDPGAGGDTIATDDITGVKYQRVKLVDGTEDSTAAIGGDATNGLDVDVTRVQGTVTVSGTVTASGPLTDTQLRATPVPVSGTVTATTGGLTDTQLRASAVPVDTELPAAAALADATVNPTVPALGALALLYNGTTWDRVRGDTTNGVDVDVTRVSGNVTVVQSTATNLKVDASGVAVPVTDNAGSLTVDAPVGTPAFVKLSDGAASLVGQKAMAASLPVVIASDQSAVPVSGTVTASGPLTDTQLRATPVPVSGTVTANAGTGPFPVSDNAGSLTVDAPVATPVFVRLSDGAAAITALPVTDNAGSLTVDNNGTFAVQATVAPATTGGLTVGPASGAKLISAATTNSTSVKGSAGQVYGWYMSNANASSAAFVKIYNKATAPTVGTDIPVLTLMIPAGSGANTEFSQGIAFGTGIGLAITGAVTDADTTAVAANDVVVNLLFK